MSVSGRASLFFVGLLVYQRKEPRPQGAGALSTMVTAAAAEPIKAHVTNGMDEMRKVQTERLGLPVKSSECWQRAWMRSKNNPLHARGPLSQSRQGKAYRRSPKSSSGFQPHR
jgi:hypothetical protein